MRLGFGFSTGFGLGVQALRRGCTRDKRGCKRDEWGCKRDKRGCKRNKPGCKRNRRRCKRDKGATAGRSILVVASRSRTTITYSATQKYSFRLGALANGAGRIPHISWSKNLGMPVTQASPKPPNRPPPPTYDLIGQSSRCRAAPGRGSRFHRKSKDIGPISEPLGASRSTWGP